MHMGNQQESVVYSMCEKGAEVPLEIIEVEKDLGVNVDNRLSFKQHILVQTQKATRLVFLIRRSFTYLDAVTLPLLYKSIVRPHLEYCNVVWQPHFKKDCELLEAVQHRATKLVPSLRNKTYEERLKILDLPSLYYRRARGDVIECYKYMSHTYNTEPNFFEKECSSTRGHMFKLKKHRSQKLCRQHFFSNRVTNAWNRLPEHVVSAPTLNSFKNRLDKLWKPYKFCTNLDWYV